MKESTFSPEKMLWGILENEYYRFHCVQHTWKLTRISAALGMKALALKESYFLSKNVFWETAVGYLRNSECYSFQTFAIVFSTPENLLIEISGTLRNERKPLCKQKCVFRKCSGVSQKQWMLELSNLCHCVQHLWKLTNIDFLEL